MNASRQLSGRICAFRLESATTHPGKQEGLPRVAQSDQKNGTSDSFTGEKVLEEHWKETALLASAAGLRAPSFIHRIIGNANAPNQAKFSHSVAKAPLICTIGNSAFYSLCAPR